MSEETVLGKRERNGAPKDVENSDEEEVGPQPVFAATGNEEDDDDDIGPMPIPDNGTAARKKRKGMIGP
jgi:peptidylprolyl isomerase domain and WD repeat-containing protein 1